MQRDKRTSDPSRDQRKGGNETAAKAMRRAAERATRRRGRPLWIDRAIRWAPGGLAVAVVAGIATWTLTSDALPRTAAVIGDTIARIGAQGGLRLAEVYVEGRHQTPREEILAVLGVRRGDPLLAFDPAAARQALERLPWVASVRVERHLPDVIRINITERRPMALWQNGGRLALVDTEGHVLTDRGLDRYAGLPLVVGPDAPAHAPAMIAMLAEVPFIAARVTALVRVGGRRWDLRLDERLRVMLPEDDVPQALRRLATLDEEEGLTGRDVLAIDLRLRDRIVAQRPEPPKPEKPEKAPPVRR